MPESALLTTKSAVDSPGRRANASIITLCPPKFKLRYGCVRCLIFYWYISVILDISIIHCFYALLCLQSLESLNGPQVVPSFFSSVNSAKHFNLNQNDNISLQQQETFASFKDLQFLILSVSTYGAMIYLLQKIPFCCLAQQPWADRHLLLKTQHAY